MMETLSEREMEIARLVWGRRRNAEIADELSVELGTVKNHLHHIYEKLGLRNRTELAQWYQRHERAG